MMAGGVSLLCLAVETGREFIKVVVRSAMVPKAAKISVPLWRQATGSPKAKLQLEAYDDVGNLLIKSPVAEVEFLPSVNGVNHVSDTSNPSIVADIAANTAARHTHANTETLDKLGETNGSLTYDGKPVGGDSRAVIEETFTEEFGDFAFTLTESDTYPVKNAVLTVASTSMTENTEIKSVKILFSGKTDYIDVKDIPLKHNAYYEPCIVSAFHPIVDDGSESFVEGFKVATLYFPFNCQAYSDISNGSYSAVAVQYYGG